MQRKIAIIVSIIMLQLAIIASGDFSTKHGDYPELDEQVRAAQLSGGINESPYVYFTDGSGGGQGVYDQDLVGVPYLSTSGLEDMDFDDKIERYNPIVHDNALMIASEYPGSYSISQICAIYEYLHENWQYINDPTGGNYLNYANESIVLGEKTGSSGVGDCDDFAVLMASLIETIGGSTRIIHTEDWEGSHAYAEVYVGDRNSAVSILWQLLKKYDPEPADLFKMFCHINWNSNDCWMNLDWSANHPGGKYPTGEKSWVLWTSNHSLNSPAID